MEDEFGASAHHLHDKGYKFLLSSKRVFMELLTSFVDRGWVKRMDEASLTKVDKSYILQDFREKEADLVYQVELMEQPVIFYVLLEMQSSVDFQMPYRLLLYMTEVWRDVLKNTKSAEAARKDFKLPVIVPIVLYSGAGRWTASRSFRETLARQEWFGDEVLDFKYILIDVQDYREEQLLELSNLIGSVFLLERRSDIRSFLKQLEQLAEVLEKLPDDLFPLFQAWIKRVAGRGLTEGHKQRMGDILNQYREPEEVRSMISNLEKAFESFEFDAERKGVLRGIEQGIEQGIEKGIEQGIEQGIEKGIEQGKLEVARTMLGKGAEVAFIVEMTGLPAETIERLKKN